MIFGFIDAAMQEMALFAACGFLLLGLSDFAIDLIWIGHIGWRRLVVYQRFDRAQADTLS